MSTPAPRTHAYNLHVALRCTAPVPLQAEFDCAAGELLALVGPSGSGKTTLLRAVAGLYQPPGLSGQITLRAAETEHIWFDSQRSIALAPQARHVGLVFQQYALFPHLSALKNIAVCAPNHWSKHQIQGQAMALLERLGLASLAQRLPHQLSGGQQQRVALARAVLMEPQVILADEPTASLDDDAARSAITLLARAALHCNATLVIATHDARVHPVLEAVFMNENSLSPKEILHKQL